MGTLTPSIVQWSVLSRPRRGELVSGDGYVIKSQGDRCVIAVMDGLGHGFAAAEAMKATLSLVTQHSDQTLSEIARRCHQGRPGMRGGVISLGLFDSHEDTFAWLGIGNVAGTLVRKDGTRELLLPRGGLLGRNLPALNPTQLSIAGGDTLVVTTDGMLWTYDEDPIQMDEPDRMARTLFLQHASEDDDALVLVVRYLGRRNE